MSRKPENGCLSFRGVGRAAFRECCETSLKGGEKELLEKSQERLISYVSDAHGIHSAGNGGEEAREEDSVPRDMEHDLATFQIRPDSISNRLDGPV